MGRKRKSKKPSKSEEFNLRPPKKMYGVVTFNVTGKKLRKTFRNMEGSMQTFEDIQKLVLRGLKKKKVVLTSCRIFSTGSGYHVDVND